MANQIAISLYRRRADGASDQQPASAHANTVFARVGARA